MRLYRGMDMLEKRRYGRLPIELPVILRHGGRIIPATALNLSCGGMCLKIDERELSGDHPVEVIFDLDEEQRDISMRGQITRVEDAGGTSCVGIQFTNLFSLSHRAVQQYLNKNLN